MNERELRALTFDFRAARTVMAAVSLGCLLGVGEAVAGGRGLPGIVLWAVLLGTLWTIVRRLRRIAGGLRP